MKDEDLEKTRSIESLVDFEKNQSRLSRMKQKNDDKEMGSRIEKYNIETETSEEVELEKLSSEEAEEALAEKNIAEAEKILKEENSKKDDEKDNDKKPKKKLTEKQKTIILIVAGVVVLITLVIVMILIFKKPKEETPQKNAEIPTTPIEVEEPPAIVDNYYYQDGKLHLLNNNEEVIGIYECSNKDEKLCFVALNNYRDDFDVDILKDENGDERVQRLKIYNNDYVFIFDNDNVATNNIVLYSIKENKKLSNYTNVKAFSNNYVITKDDKNKYGLIQINTDIKEVINNQYDYLGMIEGQENLIAKNSKGYLVINKKNQVLSASIAADSVIKNYNDDLIVTSKNKKYSVYDYEGNEIVNDYTFATISEDYMGLVKSKKLYVRDIKGNKYNEEGITLKNITYVREYIYDTEDKLVKTNRSFSLSEKDDSIEVIIYDTDVNNNPTYINLNLNIGKVNQKYPYVNYLDNKLYIYSDKEKERLIGSYTCINKNTIENAESELTSCYIAKDTIYEDNELITDEEKARNNLIPIINNKYAFIKDGSDVILIDLTKETNSQILGTYTSVNTYTGSNNDTLSTYSGMVNVIAISKKSNSYGMLNIENSSATKVYDFQYKHMEKIGDYILAQNEDNTWSLLNGPKGANVTYTGKIVNYSSDKKYFKILEGGKYFICDVNGTKVTETSYKDTILYSNFYLGINTSNELYLYNYKGEAITNRAVKVGNTCSLKEPYKVEVKDNKYHISVCNGDKYDISIYDPAKHLFEGDKVETPSEEEKPNEE